MCILNTLFSNTVSQCYSLGEENQISYPYIITVNLAFGHGSPTRSPPGCIKRSAGTVVNFVYTLVLQKIRNNFDSYQLIPFIFHVGSANQPTITGVTLCHKMFETHAFGLLEPDPKQVSLSSLPILFWKCKPCVGQLAKLRDSQPEGMPRCELRCGTFPYLSELGRELPRPWYKNRLQAIGSSL
jgi:hypothetical protein